MNLEDQYERGIMLSIAVQMDPIQDIKIKKDTTFAFMLEAQRRGHTLWYYEPQDLFFDDGMLRASGMTIHVDDIPERHYTVLDQGIRDISTFDVVLVRQDPPFDMGYVANTYLLELVSHDVLVINSPCGIRNVPEKLAAIKFYDLMPPTFVGRNIEQIKTFSASFDEVVLKPAFLGMGNNVFRTSLRDDNFCAYVNLLLKSAGKEPILAQKFLSNVLLGDKRIMMLGGEPVGVLRRIPPQGDFRANVVVGGRPELGDLDDKDKTICQRVGAVLRDQGIHFAGIDIIDGFLNEINVTSPTLVRELLAVGGPNISELFWDYVEMKALEDGV
jgi:glutathione synthase